MIGNVLKDKLSKIHGSKRQRKFGRDKAILSGTCNECQYKIACNGGCPKHRLATDESGIPHNVLCPGYKQIFAHIDPYMQYMAKEISQGRAAANIMNVAHLIR